MIYVFILNMNAGKNNSYLIGKIIENYCKEKKVNYFINYSYSKEDTVKTIEKYKNLNNVAVYSVGGDGTLNQIINSIANTNLSLSVIPAGTGNDFYRSLSVHNGTSVDLGKVNDRYFINVASFGIDSEIANTANIFKNKNIKGNLVYPLSILKNYFTYKSQNINIDNTNKEITLLAVCNGRFYGGGFEISPNSDLNDGLFDIFEVGDINKLKTLNLLLKLVKGRHINDELVKIYKLKTLQINSEEDVICNLDGEIIKGKNFNFSICENAIKLYNDELKIKELLRHKRIIK